MMQRKYRLTVYGGSNMEVLSAQGFIIYLLLITCVGQNEMEHFIRYADWVVYILFLNLNIQLLDMIEKPWSSG